MTRIIFILIVLNSVAFAQTDSLNYYFINYDYDNITRIGEKLISTNIATEKDFIKTAQAYSANFQYKKALDILHIAQNKYTTNNSIKYAKATILYKNNRLNSSAKAIETLLKLDSLNKKYLLLAMKISNAQKNYKKSIKYNKLLLLSDSTNSVFNYLAGKTSVKLKNNEKALQYFEKAVSYDTTYSNAYKWLGKIYDAFRDWDTSLYYTNKAIEIEPDNISYYTQRANTNYDRTHYYRALPDFEKVWQTDTTSSKISFKLGVCYLQIKKYDLANKLFLKSYSIDSTNYKINQYLGMSYHHLKQYDKAVHFIEKAQQIIQPDKNIVIILQSHLAINYFENKQYKKAIEYNKIMSKYRPQSASWYFYFVAESYFALNDFRNAKNYYDKITLTLPTEYQETINAHLIVINEHLFFKQGKK